METLIIHENVRRISYGALAASGLKDVYIRSLRTALKKECYGLQKPVIHVPAGSTAEAEMKECGFEVTANDSIPEDEKE